MLVPGLIFLACFGGGVTAAAYWLPALASGRVGGLAFFLVCGLLGSALGEVGLGIYSIAHGRGVLSGFEAELFASGVRDIMINAGTLAGLAGIVYLLAPPGEDEPSAEERLPAEQAS